MNQLQADNPMRDLVDDLLACAKDQVLSENGDVHRGGPELEAMLAHRALKISEQQRLRLRIAQGYLVAHISRKQLYEAYPGISGKSPKHRFRNFLRIIRDENNEQLLSPSAVSTLTGFGADVVPYCDEQDVEIDHLLTEKHWPKLVDCVPALRKAVRDDDVVTLEEILEDVGKATNREAIRSKYQDHRHRLGVGAIIPMIDTPRVMVAILLHDSADIEEFSSQLGSKIEWGVPATAQLEAGNIRLDMEAK